MQWARKETWKKGYKWLVIATSFKNTTYWSMMIVMDYGEIEMFGMGAS